MRDELPFLSVAELGEEIRARRLSPVELTELYLKRSESEGRDLGAYALLTPERARREAQRAAREIAEGHYRGPLHGIPYALKDLLNTEGANTEWGARPYIGQRFDWDATVVRRLADAGAILVGKAAMIELAGGMGYRSAGASSSGPARNPWNVDCWTCGSSSGSAAVVAGGLAAFAIGTETWGSILCPSSFCGVSGMRPTYGRVSRHGAMSLSYSMDKVGPMARSAEDCALVLEASAGHDDEDPGSLPADEAAFVWAERAGRAWGRSRDASLTERPLRIGVLADQWERIAPGIQSAFEEALVVMMGTGATVVRTSLPDGPWQSAASIVISVEGATAFQGLLDSGGAAQLADPVGWIGGYISESIAGADYLRALRLRGVLQERIDALFDTVDVLAAPTLPITATRIEANIEEEFTFSDPIGGIGNLSGLPAISVPSGLVDGMPCGIQFVGRALDDERVLQTAALFQSRTDWHRRRPDDARVHAR